MPKRTVYCYKGMVINSCITKVLQMSSKWNQTHMRVSSWVNPSFWQIRLCHPKSSRIWPDDTKNNFSVFINSFCAKTHVFLWLLQTCHIYITAEECRESRPVSSGPAQIHLVQFIMETDSTLLNLSHTNTISPHTLGATGRQDTHTWLHRHTYVTCYMHTCKYRGRGRFSVV